MEDILIAYPRLLRVQKAAGITLETMTAEHQRWMLSIHQEWQAQYWERKIVPRRVKKKEERKRMAVNRRAIQTLETKGRVPRKGKRNE
jgi:hypothetical protein